MSKFEIPKVLVTTENRFQSSRDFTFLMNACIALSTGINFAICAVTKERADFLFKKLQELLGDKIEIIHEHIYGENKEYKKTLIKLK